MFWKKRTYLDFAAGVSGNPSSPHEEGRKAKKSLEEARAKIARLTEVQKDDVVFTSGATEANALAILGSVQALREASNEKIHILYLPSAHASIVENVKRVEKYGVEVDKLPIKNYRVDTDALSKILRENTTLVSMEAVCGETGVIWNTREVKEALLRFRDGEFKNASAQAARPILHAFLNSPSRILLHVDASQAPMTEKIKRAHFGADILTLDSSKISDARGIGALIAHRTIPISSLYSGGGQERGLRSGSEAPDLAQTFASALEMAVNNRLKFRDFSEHLRADLIKDITQNIPNILINEGKDQAPHILNISLLGRDTDYVTALLDEAGFAVSTRSACETDSEDGSRAVYALTNDIERARSTLRISWGARIRARDLQGFAKALVQSIAFIDNEGQR